MAKMMDPSAIAAVKEIHDDALLQCKDVVAIDIQPKQVQGISTGKLGISVYVKVKLPREQLEDHELVPPEVGGIPTDVVECSRYWPSEETASSLVRPYVTMRPLEGGQTIFARGTFNTGLYGTLGLAAVKNGIPIIATCAHVVSSANDAPLGEKLFIAGSPRSFGRSYARYRRDRYNVDLGLATIDWQQWPDQQQRIEGIGIVSGYASPQEGETVTKYGSTTGKTTGRISSVNLTFVSQGDASWPTITLRHQLRVDGDWALAGDSGAFVVNKDNKVVGMVIGGFPGEFSVCNRAEDMQRFFNPWAV